MKPAAFRVDAEGNAVLLRLLLGLGSIVCSHVHATLGAGIILVLCVWLDGVTGWVFRKRGEKSPSTSALEYSADLVCFVAAPMEFIAGLAVHPGVLVLLPVFLVAAVYRLARFQVEGLVNKSYQGLPVTYNGYWFSLAGLAIYFAPNYGDFIIAGLLIVTSALMVSRRLLIPEL
jgi:phosphatidylserine synthase